MSTINDQYNDILKTEYFVAGKRIQNLWVVQVFPCLYSEDKSCQGFPEIQHTCSAPSSTDSKSWWRNPPPVDKQNQIHWLILQKQQNNSLQEKNWTVVLKQPSYVDPVSRTHKKYLLGWLLPPTTCPRFYHKTEYYPQQILVKECRSGRTKPPCQTISKTRRLPMSLFVITGQF